MQSLISCRAPFFRRLLGDDLGCQDLKRQGDRRNEYEKRIDSGGMSKSSGAEAPCDCYVVGKIGERGKGKTGQHDSAAAKHAVTRGAQYRCRFSWGAVGSGHVRITGQSVLSVAPPRIQLRVSHQSKISPKVSAEMRMSGIGLRATRGKQAVCCVTLMCNQDVQPGAFRGPLND